jgi:hypothetical protein
MSDREILLKQWRNLPVNERVTWETFKRQQRPKIVRRSRPDDEKMFEAAEAVGSVRNDEIHDFGPEC